MESDPSHTHTLLSIEERGVVVPQVRITVALPHGEKLEAVLGMTPLVLGQSADCDLVLVDSRVSRRHCELRLTERGIVLRDLGSKNGTMIDHVPVVEAILEPGATAKVGRCRLSAVASGTSQVLPLSREGRFGEAVGQSIAMRALFARLERAAATAETILLLGESGTGKEELARAIHTASPRGDKPFVVLDCGAVAPTLLEADLFGYARGAFTGAQAARAGLLEQASGGTLFIDEIGEMPLDLQPKLLRAIEARKVRRLGSSDWRDFDARIIAATHRDLRARIADGSFREDLYYRLAVVEVHVPALRDRKEDIPLLVEHFLAKQPSDRGAASLPPAVVKLLLGHDWPGNVRELRNIVTRLRLFPDLSQEVFDDITSRAQGLRAAAAPVDRGPKEITSPEVDNGLKALLKLSLREMREVALEQIERRYLAAKLTEHRFNISRIAEDIGTSRQLVYRLLDRHGLRDGSEDAPRNEG